MEYTRIFRDGELFQTFDPDGQSFPEATGNSDNDLMVDRVGAGTATIRDVIGDPVPTYADLRQQNVADGGYGTIAEQLEMIGEGTMTAYKAHVQAVKTRYPK
jgi:hypothetical protein